MSATQVEIVSSSEARDTSLHILLETFHATVGRAIIFLFRGIDGSIQTGIEITPVDERSYTFSPLSLPEIAEATRRVRLH